MKNIIYILLIFSLGLNAQENDYPTLQGQTYSNGLDTITITNKTRRYDAFTTQYYTIMFDEPAWVTPMVGRDHILVEMINLDYNYTIGYFKFDDNTIVVGNRKFLKNEN